MTVIEATSELPAFAGLVGTGPDQSAAAADLLLRAGIDMLPEFSFVWTD